MLLRVLVTACLFVTFSLIIFAQQQASTAPTIRTHAIEINVDDLQKAEDFYIGKLGFEIAERKIGSVTLISGSAVQLVLRKAKTLHKTGADNTGVGLTLQVNDLDEAITRLKSRGIKFDEAGVRKEGVGNAISIYDPFGRRISLMHQTIVKVDPFKEPRIYNFGVKIPDMGVAREFYVNKLGLGVLNERYLPKDLPLTHADRSFAFMLHFREPSQKVKYPYPSTMAFYTMVFATKDLKALYAHLSSVGVEIVHRSDESIAFRDPFGNVSEVVAMP
jgi:catechol-2,3-dioxygenase